MIANAQLLLELGDPHLQRRGVPAFKRIDARLKLHHLVDELLVFRFEQRGRLMQALGVTLEVGQRRHEKRINTEARRLKKKPQRFIRLDKSRCFKSGGLSPYRPTRSLPSSNSAHSLGLSSRPPCCFLR